tara:strand:- start:1132 stop:1695 length:564 start_codon:yes stop_codon:yes gene_type:complete
MDFSNITDEELMWEAKKRFAIPIYYNKQEAEKKIREKDDTFKGMSDDEWDNFKDDFNTGDSDQDQFDKILHDVAYFRFYDGSSVCIDCNDDVRTKEAFWGCQICGLNTCEECCQNDHGYVRCAGCVEKEAKKKPKCVLCDDECVDYDDKLCHGCYHKSVGADECWCASAVKKPKKKKKRKRLVIVGL